MHRLGLVVCQLTYGCWTSGGPKVYDVTKYLNDHPGGPEIILDLAGIA
jgi:cytochrome b involved in lipid metabolism